MVSRIGGHWRRFVHRKYHCHDVKGGRSKGDAAGGFRAESCGTKAVPPGGDLPGGALERPRPPVGKTTRVFSCVMRDATADPLLFLVCWCALRRSGSCAPGRTVVSLCLRVPQGRGQSVCEDQPVDDEERGVRTALRFRVGFLPPFAGFDFFDFVVALLVDRVVPVVLLAFVRFFGAFFLF